MEPLKTSSLNSRNAFPVSSSPRSDSGVTQGDPKRSGGARGFPCEGTPLSKDLARASSC